MSGCMRSCIVYSTATKRGVLQRGPRPGGGYDNRPLPISANFPGFGAHESEETTRSKEFDHTTSIGFALGSRVLFA